MIRLTSFSLPSNLQEDLECSHPGSNWSKLSGRNCFKASTQLTSSAKHGRGSTWIDASENFGNFNFAHSCDLPTFSSCAANPETAFAALTWSSNRSIQHSCTGIIVSGNSSPLFASLVSDLYHTMQTPTQRSLVSARNLRNRWTKRGKCEQGGVGVFAVLALVCSWTAKRAQPIEVSLIALP